MRLFHDLRGQILLNAGVINQGQLDKALAIQREKGGRIGQILVRAGFVTESVMLMTLERQFGFPVERVSKSDLNLALIEQFSEQLARKYECFPLRKTGQMYTLAISNPLSYEDMDSLELALGLPVELVFVADDMLLYVLEQVYGQVTDIAPADLPVIEPSLNKEPLPEEDVVETETEVSEVLPVDEAVVSEDVVVAPVEEIPLAEPTLKRPLDVEQFEALADVFDYIAEVEGDDVYFVASEGQVQVRIWSQGVLVKLAVLSSMRSALSDLEVLLQPLRISGALCGQKAIVKSPLPLKTFRSVVSAVQSQTRLDVRLKLMPLNLDHFDLEWVGLDEREAHLVEQTLKKRCGILMVVGSENSGMTTTLAVLMKKLVAMQAKVVCLEDTMEVVVPGVQYVAWNHALQDLGFDVLVIDHVASPEMAQLAFDASLAGKFIVLGVKARDVRRAYLALERLNIPTVHFVNEVELVLHQKLLCLTCPHCCQNDLTVLSSRMRDLVGHESFVYGSGCAQCFHSGFRGRKMVSEVLYSVRHGDAVDKNFNLKYYGQTLQQKGILCLRNQETSLDELVRLGLV